MNVSHCNTFRNLKLCHGNTLRVLHDERYIDLLEIKECGLDILFFGKKQNWTGFFEVYEPIYPRLVRASFSIVEVDHINFTLKATIKGYEILLS